MHPNFIALVICVGLVLALFSGELFRYFVQKIMYRKGPRKCAGHACGRFGWTLAREDSESCHALCVKCGWTSHFDRPEWQELDKR